MHSASALPIKRPSLAKPINYFLTSPNKVAEALDWKKSSGHVLSLNITKTAIDVAVSSHPQYEEPVEILRRIPLHLEIVGRNNRKRISDQTLESMRKIMHNNDVCGLLVAWPVTSDGRCGSSCGRVLHCLDQITPILNTSKPVSLYDLNHYNPDEDEWGRAPKLGITPPPTKKIHIASVEQYRENPGDWVCRKVWTDFCKVYWPQYEVGDDVDLEDSYTFDATGEYDVIGDHTIGLRSF
jgi:hypothetical protein